MISVMLKIGIAPEYQENDKKWSVRYVPTCTHPSPIIYLGKMNFMAPENKVKGHIFYDKQSTPEKNKQILS